MLIISQISSQISKDLQRIIANIHYSYTRLNTLGRKNIFHTNLLLGFSFCIHSTGERQYLVVRFEGEARNHEQQDWDNVVLKGWPVTDLEGSHKGTHQHKEDCSRTQDGTSHQHSLQQRGDINFSSLVSADVLHSCSVSLYSIFLHQAQLPYPSTRVSCWDMLVK